MMRLLQASLLAVACHGFAFSNNKATKAPDLEQLAPQLFSQQLKFRVAVGDQKSPFQMKDLVVELTNTLRVTKRASTGIHEATLLRKPYFVNDQGEQAVTLREGGWEISWRKDSPHGHLTCSCVSTEPVQRTKEGAILEAGRFFLNHRVWTRATLESERERRRQIQSEAAQHLEVRNQKIKKITDEEGSLGSKVVSYAQAAKAVNDYKESGYQEALYVPLYDEQVLELTPDLILSTRGEVFQIDSRGRPERIGLCRVDFLKEPSSQ